MSFSLKLSNIHNILIMGLSCIILLYICTHNTQAQETSNEKREEAEEVIAKYIQAIGGKENLLKINSMTLEGSGDAGRFGVEMPITIHIKNPGKNKVEIAIMNQKMVRATDGEISWAVNPFMGKGQAQQIPQYDNDTRNNVLYTLGKNLIDYKERGYTAEYLGRISFRGKKVHHIRLVSDLAEDEYYIDARTFYLLMAKVDFANNYYDNYEKIGDITIPHSIEGEKNDFKIQVEKVIINNDIDDTEFEMPFSQFNIEENILLNQNIEDETFDISEEDDVNPNEIAQKFLDKIGYPLKVNTCKSLRVKGVMFLGSIEVPFQMYQQKMDKFRLETSIMNEKVIVASNGKQAWEKDPFGDATEAMEIDPSELDKHALFLDFGQDLGLYSMPSYSLEYLGQTHVKGKDAHVLKLIYDSNYEEGVLYFIEKETSLLLSKYNKFTGEQIFYDNYQMTDNQTIPYLIEQINPTEYSNTKIKFEKIFFDEKLDKNLFKLPK